MEINAYALLHLIIKFRDEKSPELFLPTLFTSQTCESTFRQMRSMTTINWTRINFSLLELFHIASRIELVNDIVHYRLNEQNVIFPRIKNCSKQYQSFALPSDDTIQNILCQAQKRALLDASKFGMHLELSEIMHCPLSQVTLKEVNNIAENIDIESEDENLGSEEQTYSCASLRDYARDDMQVDNDSKFVQVFNDDGTSKCVLKSTLLWLMTESKDKLSKDRLSRVRGTTPKRTSLKRKLSPQTSHHAKKSNRICMFPKNCALVIGVSFIRKKLHP